MSPLVLKAMLEEQHLVVTEERAQELVPIVGMLRQRLAPLLQAVDFAIPEKSCFSAEPN